MGKTKLPLIGNVIGGVLVVLFTWILLFTYDTHPVFRYFAETLLRVDDIAGTKILMLPLGYSLGMITNVLILLYFLRQQFPGIILGLKRAFLHSFATSVVMGFVAYHSLQAFALILDINTFLGIFTQGFVSGLIGVFAGVFLLRLMENEELKEIWGSLHRKFWKQKPIATEVESF